MDQKMIQDHNSLSDVQDPHGFPEADSWLDPSCGLPPTRASLLAAPWRHPEASVPTDRRFPSFFSFALVSSASQLAMMEVGTMLLTIFLIKLDVLKEEMG